MDRNQQLLLTIYAIVVSTYFFYIAWFKPKLHQKYLHAVSKLYNRWDPASAEWVNSKANFWITRIAVTIAFLSSIVAFLIVAV